ncbi:MAG: efflux transporter outer membrane subunit [Planctomycetes bacterium]|nr:efflux transporter outer membrane subunit [Planctomycetota bacterium]
MNKRLKKSLIAANKGFTILMLPILLIAGCKMGPDYQRPETLADTGTYNNSTQINIDPNTLDDTKPWWLNFGDPITSQLVQTALDNNLDLKVSAARVLESEALLAQAFGSRLPQVSYGANRDRSKFYFNSPFGRMSFLSTTWGHQLSINYVTDIFGKLRRAEEATWRQVLATQADRQTMIHSIVAQVVRTRVQIATRQRLLNIAQATTKSWRDSLAILERRYEQGLTESLDVHIAKENLAASLATENVLEQTLMITFNALNVLLGQRPGTTTTIAETLSELPDLEPPPAGVPANLLDRRPDVISAEMLLAASTARLGVSIASLYPDLTLSGSYGFRGSEFEDLFIDETEVYSLVMQLAQPLFMGGQLQAQVDASQAQMEQAAGVYAGTVLNAFREVEDALVKEKFMWQRVTLLEERFNQAQIAEKLARERYQKGLQGILIVLETERRRRFAENELALAKGDLWTNRIDMFLALGGDWVEAEVAQNNTN